jgi:ferredoxin-NADP reductase
MTLAAVNTLTDLQTPRPGLAPLVGPSGALDGCRPLRVRGVSETETETMSLRVRQLRHEADGVVSALLVDPAGGALPAWTAGAHLELQLPSGRIRHYSLGGDPDDRSSYLVAVLREVDGRGGSIEIHDSLRVGSYVEVRGPRNNFALTDAEDYILIAGGIGITPILSMARQLKSRRPWRLYYGGRSRQSMAFVSEVEQLSGDGTVEISPSDELGPLDLDRIFRRVTEESAIYCCGPERLLSAAQERCSQLGMADRLHLERFSAPSAARAAVVESSPADDGFDVELARTGTTVRVEPQATTLDALRTVLPNLPSDCETGICGTCEVRVLGGVPEHHDYVLSDSEREAGNSMLVCVSRSRTPKLLLDL